MQKQKIFLPAVETTPEFKEKVEQTCRTAGLPYPLLVLRLLRKWIDQDTGADTEPDPDFVANAHEAFKSERVQQSLRRLAEGYDSGRTYPHAVKIS